MNCWRSGKYVHLLYMYSILGRGSFCFNYCLNSAWHGGDQFVALLRWCEAQVSLTVAFSSSACFGLLFLIFLLTIPHIFSMFRSGEFAGQSSTSTHGHLTNFGAFGSVDRRQILLENEISIFKKLVSRRKHEVLHNFLLNGCSDVGFQKTQWTNTSRWHYTQIITDCGNLTLDFKKLGLWASPPFLQTLGPWFPNEIQNLLSSEKRTLDHWATVQFFFFLAQVRRLWRQL